MTKRLLTNEKMLAIIFGLVIFLLTACFKNSEGTTATDVVYNNITESSTEPSAEINYMADYPYGEGYMYVIQFKDGANAYKSEFITNPEIGYVSDGPTEIVGLTHGETLTYYYEDINNRNQYGKLLDFIPYTVYSDKLNETWTGYVKNEDFEVLHILKPTDAGLAEVVFR